MNILCVSSQEEWIDDRIAKEFQAYSGHSVSFNNYDAKVIWLLAPWIWKRLPLPILKNKKVVCTIHHEVPDKFDANRLKNFKERDQYVDAYHTPCQKTKNFIQSFTSKPVHVIPYWVNDKLWRPLKNKKKLQKKYKIPVDQLIVGSFQRDTEGSDLKTPKLEKGPDIFCDIIERLNPKPHVVLGGWRREYVINRLKSKNINLSFFELVDLNSLNELYNCLDLYLVTSRHEGGPQAILEAVATDTPILSTDVGMASHVLSEECIMSNEDEFVDFI